ncbi:hypothetical protein [Clostridium pasteurianum]|uniref:Uncharacterized protein n=1 Tax=Clostridium pasteurianum BC1 TaxID=86416 RepID=R4K6T5_CLOPA|nr:hypothetical protein [Clostridium pasteurianum]AGK97406.1 hypothetical protein Clopa_2546 [Clostridium pasteurianum BC1]
MLGKPLYTGTRSSNGIETTAQANTLIDFIPRLIDLKFIAVTACSVKINNESNAHYLRVNDVLELKNFPINSITIAESGAQYIYHATY